MCIISMVSSINHHFISMNNSVPMSHNGTDSLACDLIEFSTEMCSSILHHIFNANVGRQHLCLGSNFSSRRWLGKHLYMESKSLLVDLLKFTSRLSWCNTMHFNMITYDTIVVNTFIIPLFLLDSITATVVAFLASIREKDVN